ncbi:DNA/RNA helicase domain-containing protein [Lysinibacillus xylanilyticus]|uniref:DNA/RNA helicase domain-containing protein n=1 Tax=Lysinibacillus xylanilyticus TaxID=582475 RepID=UPI0037F4F0BC
MKFKVSLVDEGHLLLTRSDTYNNFTDNNQLEELMKLAKIVVVVYDKGHVLKLKSF